MRPVQTCGVAGRLSRAGECVGDLCLRLQEEENGPEPRAMMSVLDKSRKHGHDKDAHTDLPDHMALDPAKGGESLVRPAVISDVFTQDIRGPVHSEQTDHHANEAKGQQWQGGIHGTKVAADETSEGEKAPGDG